MTSNSSIPSIDESHVEVLFLTGQPGAGKTAVAKEISEMLWKIREPHAVIDVDELCRGVLPHKTPDFNRSLAVANLSAVWGNFYAAGVRRLILSRIIESTDDLDHFSEAIPNATVTVCLLQVHAEMIQQRIIGREAGSAQAFLLTVTTRIAEKIATLDLPGFCVNNDERPLQAVAREIVQLAQWPAPPI